MRAGLLFLTLLQLLKVMQKRVFALGMDLSFFLVPALYIISNCMDVCCSVRTVSLEISLLVFCCSLNNFGSVCIFMQ